MDSQYCMDKQAGEGEMDSGIIIVPTQFCKRSISNTLKSLMKSVI